MVLSLKSFGNLWGNSYTMYEFFVLDFMCHFTCAFSTLWNKYHDFFNTGLSFTREVIILCKKVWRMREPWILIYPHLSKQTIIHRFKKENKKAPQKQPSRNLLGKKSHFKMWSSYSVDFYNPSHNILELCNILVKIRFTTSNTKLDI